MSEYRIVRRRPAPECKAIQFTGDADQALDHGLTLVYGGHMAEIVGADGMKYARINDWIVWDPMGKVGVYNPEAFAKMFEEAT